MLLEYVKEKVVSHTSITVKLSQLRQLYFFTKNSNNYPLKAIMESITILLNK